MRNSPVASHRLQRVLRTHLVWLDFLLIAAASHRAWLAQGPRRCRLQELAVLQSWQQYATQNPVSRRNIVRQLLAAMRYRASAQAPPVPLLMLASRQDRLVSVECSRKIAAL